jgi:gluconokinase
MAGVSSFDGPGPLAVVVMGVSGCGKSAIGEALAELLGAEFIEGDRLHPAENVALMASGVALTDEDRAGWLDAVGDAIAAANGGGRGVIAACSALKRKYRDRLRDKVPGLVFVHPVVDKETARSRIAGRRGHFMPASLVDSQFAILEAPQVDETAISLDGLKPVDILVGEAVRRLRHETENV